MSDNADQVCQCGQPECFAENHVRAKVARLKSGLRSGPCYHDPEGAPLVFFDQVFGRALEPAGNVDCKAPLRVGQTQNGLDVILVASHANAGPIRVAAGATITLTLKQGEKPDGEFVEVGPTICVKAPEQGIEAEPDHLVARFALGNFSQPWLKVSLDFAGTISGGSIDCALGYIAR